MAKLLNSKSARAGILFVCTLAFFLGAELPGLTTSNRDRVRFHWDWATEPMQSKGNAQAAAAPRQRIGLPEDFSHRAVFFPEVVPAKNLEKVQADPRFWHQYLRRHGRRIVPFDFNTVPDPNAVQEVVRDWSYSLNGGSGGTIGAPAKYSFNINAVPSCTNDFVVTGVNIAGSASQANLVGLNSLYNTPTGNGLCAGTAPLTMFAYNVGPGVINSFIAMSLDGTKVAFNENNNASSYFHILKWATGTGNGTSASAPARPGIGNTAVDVKMPLTGGVSTAPFIDYGADVAYVTTSDNRVHKFSGVFLGTPTEVVTGGWPVTTTVTGLSTPVFDGVSRHVFFTDTSTGGIDYVDDSVVPAVSVENRFPYSPGLGTAAPVIVDSGSQKVYAFSSNANGTSSVASQADTNLSAASQVTVFIGGQTGALQALMGDFNDQYYQGDSANALLYVVGNDNTSSKVPALYSIGFNSSFKMNATVTNGPRLLGRSGVTGGSASPITAFFNSSLGKQFLFVGVTSQCTSTITGGCIRSLDVTNNVFPTTTTVNSVIFAATGGTGMITIDNVSLAAGASSVYYTTRSGASIVKATQAALQ